MPTFHIRHVTTYRYRQPVAFGEHRIMLRPRDDPDQTVLASGIAITPSPSRVSWSRDRFGNHVATARFAERAEELRFESTIRLDHTPADFPVHAIASYARAYPFAYSAQDRRSLAPFLTPLSTHPTLVDWAKSFLDAHGSADTHMLLVGMTQTLKRTIEHVARHEKGILDPAKTLGRGRGSCRDLAVVMIAALRSLGIAARFVSGYLHVADDDASDQIVGGNTHAWLQAYVPGPGWIDFDPSSGTLGNHDLVRVAVVQEPGEAIPVHGTWIGAANDHLAMQVAVKVTATP